MKDVNKIFEIGVQKMGTTSLGRAYEILGLKHMGWNSEAHNLFVESKHRDYKTLFDIIDQYDAFQDGPWHDCDYRILDGSYPGSKFILPDRDDDSWIRSKEQWMSPAINAGNLDPKFLNPSWITYRDSVIEALLARKHYKYDRIKEYFVDRPDDLLVIQICDGEGWQKLCPFLGEKIPEESFPARNITAR